MRTLLVVVAGLAVAWIAWLLFATPERGDPGTGASSDASDATPEMKGQPGLAGQGTAARAPEDAPVEASLPAVDGVRLTAIVVDEHRRPVGGAQVVAAMGGRDIGRATSTADGRFEVRLPPRGVDAAFGQLRLRAGRRGAQRPIFLGPDGTDRVDYGRIALVPMHDVSVRVLRDGAPVAGAQVVLGQTQGARPGARFPTAQSDADGLARFDEALGPRVQIHAWIEGRGRAFQEVAVPADGPIDIELPPDRTATIHVRRAGTDAPVAGAEVFVGGGGTLAPPAGIGCLPPYPPLRTGEDGTLVVSGLPQEHVSLVARAPGLGMRSQGRTTERAFLKPDESEKTLTLYPYRAIRFPISEAGAGAPPDGTPLTVRRYQPLVGYDVGHPEARIEDGQLVIEPFPPGFDWGHVVSEDGRWAQWRIPQDKNEGEPVEFRAVHDVRVRLQWRDESPAVGEILWAILRPRGQTKRLRTDENGEVLFPHMVAETAAVMWTSSEQGFGMPLGRVNLVSDPGLVTFTIDRPIDIVLALRSGGKPLLPEGLKVSVPDLDPNRFGGGPRDVFNEIHEDAARGELSFRWLPMPDGSAPPVTLEAKDIAETTVTPTKGEDGVWRARVELARAATMHVRVAVPEGTRYFLKLEQWKEGDGSWVYLHDHPGYRQGRRAVEGIHVIPALGPGRYRLVEHYTGLASDPIEVSGGGDIDVPFDLTAIVEVKGRVVVPEGEDPMYASIHVKDRDRGAVSTMNPIVPKKDGTFSFRATRGERLTLVAEHPLLRPKAEPKPFVVGTDEPILRLGPGPHLVFRLEGSDLTTHEPNGNASPAWWSPVHVRVRPPERWDSEGRTYPAIATKGLCRCAAPGPGTWTVRIEQPGLVPILLEDVKVGSGATDLGTLRFTRGATLTVRILAGEGGLPQGLRARAVHQGTHPYACWAGKVAAGEPPTMTMTGLGPGRFEVSLVKGVMRGETVVTRTVESDGSSDLTLDLKLP